MNSPEPLAVKSGRVVRLRYMMRNRHNELIEDRMSGDPAEYLQGGTTILPALQSQLEGMQPGEEKTVVLHADGGDGLPDFSFEVSLVSVRDATDAELKLGYPLPVATDCGPDCDCYYEPVNGENS